MMLKATMKSILSERKEEKFLLHSSDRVECSILRLQPPTESVAEMKHITPEQSYTIPQMLEQSYTQKEIAQTIKVSRSTISREISRNRDGRNGKYRYDLAQRKAAYRRQKKVRKEIFTEEMRTKSKDLLIAGYSPEQITGRMRLEQVAMVSHETLYRWIWLDKRRGGELHTYLRRQGRKYAKRGSKNAGRGMILNRVDIEMRPKVVDDKKRFGDLEIDTIIGKNHKGAILTINDRVTGYVWIRLLEGKEAIPLAKATNEALYQVKHLIHTITADNGKEFAKHEEIAQVLGLNFYFCKPYHSWERGANEN